MSGHVSLELILKSSFSLEFTFFLKSFVPLNGNCFGLSVCLYKGFCICLIVLKFLDPDDNRHPIIYSLSKFH